MGTLLSNGRMILGLRDYDATGAALVSASGDALATVKPVAAPASEPVRAGVVAPASGPKMVDRNAFVVIERTTAATGTSVSVLDTWHPDSDLEPVRTGRYALRCEHGAVVRYASQDGAFKAQRRPDAFCEVCADGVGAVAAGKLARAIRPAGNGRADAFAAASAAFKARQG